METISYIISVPLGALMNICYQFFKHYGLAIILFTISSKIILLPLSLWVHKNSIKIVRIQPELNRIKAKFFGVPDQINEETFALYKREKYNPFADIIPLFVQLFILIGLIGVIYHPLDNLLHFDPVLTESLIKVTAFLTGADPSSSSVQLAVVDAMKNPAFSEDFLAVLGMTPQLLAAVQNLNMDMFGLNLAQIPVVIGGVMFLVPMAAGIAALLMCLVQNRLHPLQAEQGTWGKLGTSAFSVGLSLILGAFVPAAVGFYWIWSNLFTIVQQFLLNAIIDPRKSIDYADLEESRRELAALKGTGEKKKMFAKNPFARREKEDYKRFFSVSNKHLVFYSEKSGFYKYFESVIEYLLSYSDIVIHYVTSDPNDTIFKKVDEQPRIKPYYIGERKLISLMMKMDADIVVMTMPDLNKFHIKRSYVRKDVEYVYIHHYPLSTHMIFRQGAFDHYDTIFCVGKFQAAEIRESEQLYNLPSKTLVESGYGVLEKLREYYLQLSPNVGGVKRVLIAPSWQPDNILDSCIDEVLRQLLDKDLEVYIRPHPEYVKRYQTKWIALMERYMRYAQQGLVFDTDFSSMDSIFISDIIVSDWSGIAYEFAFATLKPVVFIDTPMKVNNPEYQKFKMVPLEITLRDQIGIRFEPNHIEGIYDEICNLLDRQQFYRERIEDISQDVISHFGKSGEIAGSYIIKALQQKSLKKVKQ